MESLAEYNSLDRALKVSCLSKIGVRDAPAMRGRGTLPAESPLFTPPESPSAVSTKIQSPLQQPPDRLLQRILSDVQC
jgi:hypothetical protein